MIEEPAPLHVHGRGDHESDLVNEARLEERLRERDAAVDADVAAPSSLTLLPSNC